MINGIDGAKRRLLRWPERLIGFGFLEEETGSLLCAAARYPLSYPEASTVILGTKTAKEAEVNFGLVPGGILSDHALKTDPISSRQFRDRFFKVGEVCGFPKAGSTQVFRSLIGMMAAGQWPECCCQSYLLPVTGFNVSIAGGQQSIHRKTSQTGSPSTEESSTMWSLEKS